MRITFELEPADIERFHEALARAEARVACAEECDIVAAARHALDTLPIARAPGYVRRRLREVQGLVDMLEDDGWALPQVERAEVLRLLAYFSDPEDLIPDEVAVIGLLDDAIMLELLLRRIRHVVQAWDEFRFAREALPVAAGPDDRIVQAREMARLRDRLHARMRRRTLREAMALAAATAGAASDGIAPE
ncbi:YkvA family protein [Arenimonas fontis]|nr:YkvA family protein [Arenimonas fontis]